MSRKGKAATEVAGGRKRKRRDDDAADSPLVIRIGAHPRARRSIRRVRAQAGIAGFVLTLLLAHQAGVPALETLLRALAGGIVAHVVTWAFAVSLWRRLIVVELEEAHRDLLRRTAERNGAAAAAAASAPAGTGSNQALTGA